MVSNRAAGPADRPPCSASPVDCVERFGSTTRVRSNLRSRWPAEATTVGVIADALTESTRTAAVNHPEVDQLVTVGVDRTVRPSPPHQQRGVGPGRADHLLGDRRSARPTHTVDHCRLRWARAGRGPRAAAACSASMCNSATPPPESGDRTGPPNGAEDPESEFRAPCRLGPSPRTHAAASPRSPC